MKTMSCDLCEVTAEAETFEGWMEALMPHYKEAHGEVMEKKEGMTDEEMEADKNKWMMENKTRFDAL